MLTTKPGRIATLAVGAAVVASGLVATSGMAFADDDDEFEHHGTCDSTSVTTRDDHADDNESDDDSDSRDCGTSPAPAPTPTSTVTEDPAASALLAVERATSGRLAVSAGVADSNPGEAWRLEVWQNGKQKLSTTAVADASGTVEVARSLKNRRGTDRIKLRATGESGETVTAKAKGFKAAVHPPVHNSGGGSGNNSGGNQNGSGTSKPS